MDASELDMMLFVRVNNRSGSSKVKYKNLLRGWQSMLACVCEKGRLEFVGVLCSPFILEASKTVKLMICHSLISFARDLPES